MVRGDSTSARSDVSSAVAVTTIRDNLNRLALEVRVLGVATGKVIITANFVGSKPKEMVTLRYIVEGNYVKGPNPDTFGAVTRADVAVDQIEEELYLNDFEKSGIGKRHVTYSQR